jgi:hypothetical protein
MQGCYEEGGTGTTLIEWAGFRLRPQYPERWSVCSSERHNGPLPKNKWPNPSVWTNSPSAITERRCVAHLILRLPFPKFANRQRAAPTNASCGCAPAPISGLRDSRSSLPCLSARANELVGLHALQIKFDVARPGVRIGRRVKCWADSALERCAEATANETPVLAMDGFQEPDGARVGERCAAGLSVRLYHHANTSHPLHA